MKILQLCHKPPYPLVDGGCIAINNITQGLLQSGHTVRVVAVETPKHPVVTTAFPLDYLQNTRFESIFMDTSIHLSDALTAVAKRKSYQISRFFSQSMSSKLIHILQNEEFDMIHIESIYMTSYIDLLRKYSNAKIVIRLHNIEHQIWERLAANERNPLKKIVYRVNARQLRRVERTILNKMDGYMAISQPDEQFFAATAPHVTGTVIPFGLDLDKYEDEADYIPSDEPTLFHIGSMNWAPNVEGIEWFLDEVWPEIQERHPEIEFYIAGYAIPEKLYARNERNVHVVGAVPVANDFMLSHDLMVVPLLSGSGIRIKIVEAMALGKVVITTSVGAQGLDVENGKHLFIADTPEEFRMVIDKCVTTPDLCKIIGENARNFISVYHNNRLITNQIVDFYNTIINKE